MGGSAHNRLHDFAKSVLLNILVDPYATVCDLYCGCGVDTKKWAQAQIGHYIGIDLSASALSEAREQWEYHRRPYPADFCELDPCMVNLESHLLEKGIPTDIVCCLRHLQDCFSTEDKARSLLQNVASLLKPGGYFFGITADSSTIWSKYQKAVEGAIKAGNLRVNGTLPRVRTDQYVITFEDDRFTPFGMKYQLQFSDGLPPQTQLLVHFPSLIRLATEVGLEYVEIQNMLEFYEDHRIQFAGILQNTCGSLLDPKGRLFHRVHDVLSLYTTFIFRKPDQNPIVPERTPSLVDEEQTHADSLDPVADSYAELVGGQIHDTPSLLDSRDRSQIKHSHTEVTSTTETMMLCDSYPLISNPQPSYTASYQSDPGIAQKKCDDADRLQIVDSAFCEKTESSGSDLLNHADLSPKREFFVLSQNINGNQTSRSARKYDPAEMLDHHSGNVSPDNSLFPETGNDKKPAEVKFYSRLNGNKRRHSDGRVHLSVNKLHEHEVSYQCISTEKSELGNDPQQLVTEKRFSAEKRSSSNFREKNETFKTSHQAFRYDIRSVYDEGEHGNSNERHHTLRPLFKDGVNKDESSIYSLRECEKKVKQRRQTSKEDIGEHCDIERKHQDLPSILGPGPTELRFQ